MKRSEQNISNFFKNVIMLSGTPDYVQRALSERNPENTCECSPKEAMDNGWICKPILNLISCSKNAWPSAVRSVLRREIEIYNSGSKIFKPTILINCGSIDDIVNLRNEDWFKSNTGKTFHFISIHSDKRTYNKDGSIDDITAEIDGVACKSSEAYAKIEKIDNGIFDDNLPILVAQVEMIGEGINVKSFNAVITASNSDKTAMQQIGRAIRDYKITKDIVERREVHHKVLKQKSGILNRLLKRTEEVDEVEIIEETHPHTFSKVKDGKANVYVIIDNLEQIQELVVNLAGKHDLTDCCFSWGDRIDVQAGSSNEILEEAEACKLQKSHWMKIDDVDPQIIEIINNSKEKLLDLTLGAWQSNDVDGNGRQDGEDFKALVDKWNEDKYIEMLTGRKNGIPYVELHDFMMDKIRTMLKSSANKQLWNASRRVFLNLAFGNPEVTEFFMTHMSKKIIHQLSM